MRSRTESIPLKYFDLRFCQNRALTKPNIGVKLDEIGDLSCITFRLVLPGFLMDTLLIQAKSYFI